MSYVLVYSPGQTVTVIQQILSSDSSNGYKDGFREDGYYNPPVTGPTRTDGYGVPIINRIIFPNLTLAAGYPAQMSRLDVGLYISTFTLPTGATAVGTYIVDGYWYDPTSRNLKQDYVAVQCIAPQGQYSILPG